MEGQGPGTRYTDQEREEFLALAQNIGVKPAIDLLGWPSKPTAYKWCDDYGIEIVPDTLKQRAAELRVLYNQHEKLSLLHELLRAIHQQLEHDPATGTFYEKLDGQELSRLASAASKIIQSMELLEGRATERTENVNIDPMDIELRQMIQELEERNEQEEEKIIYE